MAESQDKQEKKIIIDEDWKKEAQKEKEIVNAEKNAEKQDTQPEKHREALPKGNFAALISMLATQAFFALGLLKVEDQQEKEPDLEMARYHIDMLETVQEKTRGNLSEQEALVVQNTLHELRMCYVKMSESKPTE